MGTNLFDSLEKLSIQRLREHEPPEGYWLAFSGGKDSVVVKDLADRAGVKYQAFYNVTTIDPPDLVYFIRRTYPDVAFRHPKEPFLRRLLYMGFPCRRARWCCKEYKENFAPQGIMISGIRAEESVNRADRKVLEPHRQHEGTYFLNPIVDWASDEIWNFIRFYDLPYCQLYDRGWKRIGCLFCPSATQRERLMHAEIYPKFEQAFRRAFRLLHFRRTFQGRESALNWRDGDEMFDWWISGKSTEGISEDEMGLFSHETSNQD